MQHKLWRRSFPRFTNVRNSSHIVPKSHPCNRVKSHNNKDNYLIPKISTIHRCETFFVQKVGKGHLWGNWWSHIDHFQDMMNWSHILYLKCWSCKLICWSSLGNIRVSDLFAEVDKIAEAGKAGWQGGQILSVLGTDPNPTHGHLHPPLPLAGNSKQRTLFKSQCLIKIFPGLYLVCDCWHGEGSWGCAKLQVSHCFDDPCLDINLQPPLFWSIWPLI